MKIKLLTLAIAASPLFAHADDGITLYGKVAGNLSSVQSYTASGSLKNVQVNDNTSRIGFKGSENLGNGLTAI